MTDRNERTELLVLQAVRLAGIADLDAILDRTFLGDEEVERVIAAANETGVVEHFSFGDSSGWTITEAGSSRLAELLRRDVARQGATDVLAATLEAFEPLNGRFVALVTGWQMRVAPPDTKVNTEVNAGTPGGPGRGADAAELHELLTELESIGSELRAVLTDLIGVLPRFGRYPAQYSAAVRCARHDDLSWGWVTGIGILSCHVVWAELHQDLFSTLGRDRLAGQSDSDRPGTGQGG